MSYAGAPSSDFWIIGYGNSQRRDDGIGPYILNQLQPNFKYCKDVHLLTAHQLAAEMIDELKYAGSLLFVDATVEALGHGHQWVSIQPELETMPCLIHQVSPSLMLGLLQALYRRNPRAWMVSVQGEDFGFGSGLSSGAQKRAEQVIGEITEFVLTYLAEKDRITLTRTFRKSEARNGKSETISKF
jgi:hydrogenase maturation protease